MQINKSNSTSSEGVCASETNILVVGGREEMIFLF
jgi:hypothetical protein